MAKHKLLKKYWDKGGGDEPGIEKGQKIDFYDGVLNVHRQPGIVVKTIEGIKPDSGYKANFTGV